MALTWTPQQVIEAALRAIGALDTGETPPDDQIQDGYDILQALLDLWSIQGPLRHRRASGAFPLTNTGVSYTIGVSQTWNTVRPIRIERAFVRQSNIDYPVKIVTRERYQALPNKASTDRPHTLWYDATYPNGTVYVYPTSNITSNMHLDMLQPFAVITNLATTAITLPSEYLLALRWNLAMELAPEYGRKDIQVIAAKAQETKAALAQLHSLPIDEEMAQGATT